jgi:multisubunit Na+/H+ antiporter MnhF subunit
MIDFAIYYIVFLALLVSIKLIGEKSRYNALLLINMLMIKLSLLMILFAYQKKSVLLLDVTLTYSMVGFLSMALFSRMIAKGRRLK